MSSENPPKKHKMCFDFQCSHNDPLTGLLLKENVRLASENAKLRAENDVLSSSKNQILMDACDVIRALFSLDHRNTCDQQWLEDVWNDLRSRDLMLRDPSLAECVIAFGLVDDANELPANIRNDPSIVDLLFQRGCFSLVDDVCLDRFPPLKEHIGFWRMQIESNWNVALVSEFVAAAREIPALRADKALVQRAYALACRQRGRPTEHDDNEILELFEPSSEAEMESFLVDAVRSSCKALRIIPHDVQLRYPIEICEKIPVSEGYPRSEEIIHLLAPDLWKHRPFLLAWFQYLGALPGDHLLPAHFRHDREFWWAVLENGCMDADFSFPIQCPEVFLQDDQFMRKAVEVQNNDDMDSVYPACSERLRKDKNLALRLLEKFGRATFFYFHEHQPGNRRYFPQNVVDDYDVKVSVLSYATDYEHRDYIPERALRQLTKMKAECLPRAKERVKAHNSFHKAVLPGMSMLSSDDCTLKMLVVDPDTTLAIKRQLAEYLDVPCTLKDVEWLSKLERETETLW